jgi:EmrB/QacA subfamily drug resistance transporter
MAAFLAPFMGSSVNVALPSIGTQFAIDAVLLGWVATAYVLAAALFLVPFGRVADIRGRRTVFLSGIVVFTVSSLLAALSYSATVLVVARVAQGIGGAMIYSTSVAIITSVFPPGERGRALGINVAGVYAGLSLGPFMGGIMTQQLGWRSIFFAAAFMSLAVLVATISAIRENWADARGEKFDLVGSFLWGIALLALMYGLSVLGARPGIWIMLLGVGTGVGFVWWEQRVPHPILHMDLFRYNRVFAFSNLAAFINYSATFAVVFLLSLYLQYVEELTPQMAGIVLVAQPTVMTLSAPVAGRLSDRIEPRVVASLGMGLTSLGLLFLFFLNRETSILLITADLVLLGLGMALFSSPNTNAVMSSVNKKLYGVASGTVATMRSTGMMFSMGLAMLMLSLYLGRSPVTPENQPVFIQAVCVTFLIFAAMCAGGVFASLARGHVQR